MMFAIVIFLLILCELPDRISTEFDDLNDMIDRFDWYLLPLEIKKLLPMVMMNTQKSFGLTYFGSYRCNRESFRKVMLISR